MHPSSTTIGDNLCSLLITMAARSGHMEAQSALSSGFRSPKNSWATCYHGDQRGMEDSDSSQSRAGGSKARKGGVLAVAWDR